MKASTFQALTKTLAAVCIFTLLQLSRLGIATASACPDCVALFRGLQSVLGLAGGLALVNVNVGGK